MNTPSEVAYQALNLSKQNERDINAHEDLCAERYAHINTSISEIKGILKWAGTTGFLIIIGLLGFLAKTTWEAKEQAQQAASTKIEMLQSQLNDERRARATGAPPQ